MGAYSDEPVGEVSLIPHHSVFALQGGQGSFGESDSGGPPPRLLPCLAAEGMGVNGPDRQASGAHTPQDTEGLRKQHTGTGVLHALRGKCLLPLFGKQ